MIDIKWNPTLRELKQFAGIYFPGFCALLGGVLWHKTGSLKVAAAVWSIGFIVSLIGYLSPSFMRIVFVGLMIVAFPIGFVVSYLLLGLIYFCVFTPMGLIMRLLGHDPMHRKFDRSAKTYWSEHNPYTNSTRYFRQY